MPPKMSPEFSTRAVHTGHDPIDHHGAVNTPIFMSSTFSVADLLQPTNGHLYGRYSNPSRQVLEETFAVLENAKFALAYPSGMSAIASVIETLLKPGDHIICSHDCYGGTFAYLKIMFDRSKISYTLVDTTITSQIISAINDKTRMVLFESITNPMMKVTDIEQVASAVRCSCPSINKLSIVVDNTFMTPYFLNPLNIGADIVVHSVTKFMNGHSDVIMGAVMLNDEAVYQRLKFNHFHCGTTPSPFDCFLVHRGLKTLALRMKQHSKNARKIALTLEKHSAVERVIYPGLESHPQHELAKKLSPNGFPGMVAVQLRLKKASATEDPEAIFNQNVGLVKKFVSKLKLFTLAVSLGAVESLVDVPVLMTQGCNGVSRESLAARGINIGLIRLSVGIEDSDDLIEDLISGLDSLKEELRESTDADRACQEFLKQGDGDVIEMLKANLSMTKLSSNLYSSSGDLVHESCHPINKAVSGICPNKILSTF